MCLFFHNIFAKLYILSDNSFDLNISHYVWSHWLFGYMATSSFPLVPFWARNLRKPIVKLVLCSLCSLKYIKQDFPDLILASADGRHSYCTLCWLLSSTHCNANNIASNSAECTDKWSVVLFLIAILCCGMRNVGLVHPVSGSFETSK